MKYRLIEGIYHIEDFQQVRAECQAFIEETIANNTTKTARTLIRKKKEEIATFRKEAVRAMTDVLVSHCKQLEGMLGEMDATLTEKLKAENPKPDKPKATTIIAKVSDEETLKKAVDALIALELTVTIKE